MNLIPHCVSVCVWDLNGVVSKMKIQATEGRSIRVKRAAHRLVWLPTQATVPMKFDQVFPTNLMDT